MSLSSSYDDTTTETPQSKLARRRRRARQPSSSSSSRAASSTHSAAALSASAMPSVDQLFAEAHAAGMLRVTAPEQVRVTEHLSHEAAALKDRVLTRLAHEQRVRGGGLTVGFEPSVHHRCEPQECALETFVPGECYVCPVPEEHPELTLLADGSMVHRATGDLFVCVRTGRVHRCISAKCEYQVESQGCLTCTLTGRDHGGCYEYVRECAGAFDTGKPMTQVIADTVDFGALHAENQLYEEQRPDNADTQAREDEAQIETRARVIINETLKLQQRQQHQQLLLQMKRDATTALALCNGGDGDDASNTAATGLLPSQKRRAALPAPDGLGAVALPLNRTAAVASSSVVTTVGSLGPLASPTHHYQQQQQRSTASRDAMPVKRFTLAPPPPSSTAAAVVTDANSATAAVSAVATSATVKRARSANRGATYEPCTRRRGTAAAATCSEPPVGPTAVVLHPYQYRDEQVRECFSQHVAQWFNALEQAYSLPQRLLELRAAEEDAARRIAERLRASVRVRSSSSSAAAVVTSTTAAGNKVSVGGGGGGGGVGAANTATTTTIPATIDYCDAYERFADAAEDTLLGLTHVQLARQWEYWMSGALRRDRSAALVERMCRVWNILVQTPEFRSAPQPFLYRTIAPAIRDTAIDGLQLPVCVHVQSNNAASSSQQQQPCNDAVYTACVLPLGEECTHQSRTLTFVSRDTTLYELLEAPGIRDRVRRTLDKATLSQCNHLTLHSAVYVTSSARAREMGDRQASLQARARMQAQSSSGGGGGGRGNNTAGGGTTKRPSSTDSSQAKRHLSNDFGTNPTATLLERLQQQVTELQHVVSKNSKDIVRLADNGGGGGGADDQSGNAAVSEGAKRRQTRRKRSAAASRNEDDEMALMTRAYLDSGDDDEEPVPALGEQPLIVLAQFERQLWRLSAQPEQVYEFLMQYNAVHEHGAPPASEEERARGAGIVNDFVVELFLVLRAACSLDFTVIPAPRLHWSSGLAPARVRLERHRYFDLRSVHTDYARVIYSLVLVLFKRPPTGGVLEPLELYAPHAERALHFLNTLYAALVNPSAGEPFAAVSFSALFDAGDEAAAASRHRRMAEDTEQRTEELHARLIAPLSTEERRALDVQQYIECADVAATRLALALVEMRLAEFNTRVRQRAVVWLRSGERSVSSGVAPARAAEHNDIAVDYARYVHARQQLADTLRRLREARRLHLSAARTEALLARLDQADTRFVGLYGGKASLVRYVISQLVQPLRNASANHILVTGEPGTGKTSLLRELIPLMMESGLIETPSWTVLSAAAGTRMSKLGDDERRALRQQHTEGTGGGGGAQSAQRLLRNASQPDRDIAALVQATLGAAPLLEPPVYVPDALIGQFRGGTEALVEEAFLRTLGSMFVLDEAYAIMQRSKNDQSALLDQLTARITQFGLAWGSALLGYRRRIRELVEKANPGLASRYQTEIEFGFYTPRELCAIFVNMTLSTPGVMLSLRSNELDIGSASLSSPSEELRQRLVTIGGGGANSAAALDEAIDATLERLYYEVFVPFASRGSDDEVRRNRFGSGNARAVEAMLKVLSGAIALQQLGTSSGGSQVQVFSVRAIRAVLDALPPHHVFNPFENGADRLYVPRHSGVSPAVVVPPPLPPPASTPAANDAAQHDAADDDAAAATDFNLG